MDENYYVERKTECWRCKKITRVYDWENREMYEKRKPKEPIPKNVQFRFTSMTQDKYWLNVCENCGAVQGDFYLCCVYDGVFYDRYKERIEKEYEKEGYSFQEQNTTFELMKNND